MRVLKKILFDSTGTIAGYDSLVQKLNYNYINFNNGTTTKEALVIMKKKAPSIKTASALSINENDSLTIPLSQLFSDPDSIKNDMTYQILNVTPTELQLSISSGNLLINTNPCNQGFHSLIFYYPATEYYGINCCVALLYCLFFSGNIQTLRTFSGFINFYIINCAFP